MKLAFIAWATITFACTNASAQKIITITTKTVQRDISIGFIRKDSVNLSLNNNFELIEDSCAQITRYGHLDLDQRKFKGKFKDVSHVNPQLMVTEGNYTAEGLKDGSFTSRYLNGNLQSKGNFKNNLFDGKWELYYDDAKPKVTFEANGDDINITNSWDANGIKTVDNGNGIFRIDLVELYWKGPVVNGKPDGQWKAIKKDSNTTLLTETYKNGILQKGEKVNNSDLGRLRLALLEQLPYLRTEQLPVSFILCDGTDYTKTQK